MALRKEEMGSNDDKKGQKTKRTRITIDVSPELRRRIKMAALQEDLSISDYLGRVLEQTVPDTMNTIPQEHQPITREAIERLKRISEKIMQDRGGKLFEDTAEMIRQMR